MSLLIYSGLLYLIGISILLIYKPSIMFTTEGNWKEFGLGRSRERYTWMPFWLFAILWAILSYLIMLVIADHTGIGGVSTNTNLTVPNEIIEPENVSMKAMSAVPPNVVKKKPTSMETMNKGYYILDTNETMKQGVPKYIYLGPEAPNLIFNDTTKA
jgi:hypothetical protein